MKKLMIKKLAHGFAWPFAAIFGWAKNKISPPLRIRLSRQTLMIALPADKGGAVHILPRPGGTTGLRKSFEVSGIPGGQYDLRVTPDDLTLASYADEANARQALAFINKTLTQSLFWKWAIRFFVLAIAASFVMGAVETSRQNGANNAGKPDIFGVAPDPSTVIASAPNIPTEPAPYQAMPSLAAPGGGDLSNYIYQQARLAQEKAKNEAREPKAGIVDSNGLAGFGLKDVDGTGSDTSSQGCDPALAFTVPKK